MDDKAPPNGDDLPPRKKQWLWFFGLWLGGLLAVLLLSAAVKLLFKFS
jgi:hypothetical protein